MNFRQDGKRQKWEPSKGKPLSKKRKIFGFRHAEWIYVTGHGFFKSLLHRCMQAKDVDLETVRHGTVRVMRIGSCPREMNDTSDLIFMGGIEEMREFRWGVSKSPQSISNWTQPTTTLLPTIRISCFPPVSIVLKISLQTTVW